MAEHEKDDTVHLEIMVKHIAQLQDSFTVSYHCLHITNTLIICLNQKYVRLDVSTPEYGTFTIGVTASLSEPLELEP